MPDPQLRLKQALKNRTPIIGSWLQLSSAASAEILANEGFAWLGLDCEHTSANIASVEEISRAVNGRNAALLVRISQRDTLEIRRCLDVGASGVIVPLVESAEDARLAVSAAKYPPQGCRGFCFGRMNDWGRRFDEYIETANERVVVIVMIESKRGVECIDDILNVEGVDGAFIGPYDLSGSYGIPGQTQHPIINKARLQVVNACKRAGKAAGEHIIGSTSSRIKESLSAGFTFICLDADIILLRRAGHDALSSTTDSPAGRNRRRKIIGGSSKPAAQADRQRSAQRTVNDIE